MRRILCLAILATFSTALVALRPVPRRPRCSRPTCTTTSATARVPTCARRCRSWLRNGDHIVHILSYSSRHPPRQQQKRTLAWHSYRPISPIQRSPGRGLSSTGQASLLAQVEAASSGQRPQACRSRRTPPIIEAHSRCHKPETLSGYASSAIRHVARRRAIGLRAALLRCHCRSGMRRDARVPVS